MRSLKFKKHKSKIKRVLILGSSGIISENLQLKLKKQKIPFLVIGKKKIDLTRTKSIKKLSKIIKKDDVVVFLASNAPVKNLKVFHENIKICDTVFSSINEKLISQIIYISSDAVYADSKYKLNEMSKTEPSNFHGLMHITRERMMNLKFKNKLCILRPTMIYGIYDTHLGYGPNLFLNNIKNNQNIRLFGNGEEKRDHVFINDLINILIICIQKKAIGIANIASGKVYSFHYIAKTMLKKMNNNLKIIKIKRKSPMPHNGFRPFDISLLKKKFNKIKLTSFEIGLTKYIQSLAK